MRHVQVPTKMVAIKLDSSEDDVCLSVKMCIYSGAAVTE